MKNSGQYKRDPVEVAPFQDPIWFRLGSKLVLLDFDSLSWEEHGCSVTDTFRGFGRVLDSKDFKSPLAAKRAMRMLNGPSQKRRV